MGEQLVPEKKYLVFRIYSKKEKPNLSERAVYFGWSDYKFVIKGFMEQRSPDKYRVVKMDIEEFNQYESHNSYSNSWGSRLRRIDIIKLKSVQDGKIYPFFSTAEESKKAELDIQGLFSDLASVSTIDENDNDFKYLNMYYNLDEDYKEILEFIGYKPPEMKALFDSVEDAITDAYEDVLLLGDDFSMSDGIPGQYYIDDIAKKIIYSLESFVKILQDDL